MYACNKCSRAYLSENTETLRVPIIRDPTTNLNMNCAYLRYNRNEINFKYSRWKNYLIYSITFQYSDTVAINCNLPILYSFPLTTPTVNVARK